MGELYEAEDLELRERIALKTILAHIAANDRSIALFKREVHLARQVTHPNVCRIYDNFRHQSIVLLAMELLTARHWQKGPARGAVATADVLPIVRQMAAGLTAAHRVGVVHRDFKSQNVMLVKPTGGGRGPARGHHGFRSRAAARAGRQHRTLVVPLGGGHGLGHSGVHGTRAGRGRHR